jgi:hypothetical protein
MKSLGSWVTLGIIFAVLFTGCSAMAGGVDHYPGSFSALVLLAIGKVVNDKTRTLKWPMEFAFWAAILFIACNLTYLHYKPL